MRACLKAQILQAVWTPKNVFFAKKILAKAKSKDGAFVQSILDRHIKNDLEFDKRKVESFLTAQKEITWGPVFYEHKYLDEKQLALDLPVDVLKAEVLGLYDLVCSLQKSPAANRYQGNSFLEAFRNWEDEQIDFDLKDIAYQTKGDDIIISIQKKESLNDRFQLGVMLKNIPGHDRFLFQNWTTGHGKYMRRYMKNYAEEDQVIFHEWVKQGAEDVFQNNDPFNHGANDFADGIPMMDGFGFKEAFCKAERIGISYDDGNLVNKESKQTVYPLDLGVQNPLSRTSFYKFINAFSKLRAIYPAFLEALKKRLLQKKEGYDHVPLIKTDHLLLSIEEWIFKNKKAFLLEEKDDEKKFYLLNGFRSKIGIPRFATFRTTGASIRYVDFENPISLDAFLRRIRKDPAGELIIGSLLGPNKENNLADQKFYEVYWEFITK